MGMKNDQFDDRFIWNEFHLKFSFRFDQDAHTSIGIEFEKRSFLKNLSRWWWWVWLIHSYRIHFLLRLFRINLFYLFVSSIETEVNVQSFLFFSQNESINLRLTFKVHFLCLITKRRHWIFGMIFVWSFLPV